MANKNTIPKLDAKDNRLPPQNTEAEQSVLGSLMLDKKAIIKVADIISAEDFYNSSHTQIFQAMLDLYDKGEPIDLLSLSNRLEETKQIDSIGGVSYLTTLVNSVPTAANVTHYAKIVQRKKTLRDLIDASHHISGLGYEEREDIESVVDEAEQRIFSIAKKTLRSQEFIQVKETLEEAFERIDKLHRGDGALRGTPTGFNDLDNYLAGLQKSDLVILAARPSLGKCVAADTEIIDFKTGSIRTIEDLVKHKEKNILTLNDKFKITEGQISRFVDDGKKPVFEVKTALGKVIETTITHPFLTVSGWKPLAQLKKGQRIAMPRELNVFGQTKIPDYQIKTLSYLIADGGLTQGCPHFTNSNGKIMADFKKSIESFKNTQVKLVTKNKQRTPTYRVSAIKQNYNLSIKNLCQRVKQIQKQNGLAQKELAQRVGLSYATVSAFLNGHYLPYPSHLTKIISVLNGSSQYIAPQSFVPLQNTNTVTKWLKSLGLMGKLAIEKEIPSIVRQFTKKKLALFLNRLFSCDGSIYVCQNKKKNKSYGISYSSSSRQLIKQVQHLLLRFSIISKIRKKNVRYKNGFKIAYELEFHNAKDILKFIKEIGIFGKEKKIAKIKKQLRKVKTTWTQDTIPIEIWSEIDKVKGKKTWREIYKKMGFPLSHNIHAFRRNPHRQTVYKIGQALNSKKLKQLAESDIYWDRIISIRYKGKKQVYDLTIDGTHNFIANDFFVHNTTLALDIARHVGIRDKTPVGIFSIEMAKEQVIDRILCAEADVDLWRLRTGRLSGEGPENDFIRIQEAMDTLADAPIFIDDAASPTLMQMRTMARRLQAEHGLGLIIVDYLQMIQPTNSFDSPVQQVTDISRGLKTLARELNIPVIALSQLSRAVESRSPSIPRLSDLRESGALEQDADVVLFIYREDKDRPQTERKNIADIMIAKHRNGPIGKVELFFNESQVSFKNLEKRFEE